MKSFVKRSARSLWRALGPLHRPILRKIDGRFTRLVEETVRPIVVSELERRIHPALDATMTAVCEHIRKNEAAVDYLRRTAQENTLLLDSLVRELVRVQMRLEALDQRMAETSTDGGSSATGQEPMAAECVMIG